MPLHCEHEALPGQLQRLDHTIGIPAADHQSLAEIGDGLVVIAPRVNGFADQRGQPGAGHGAHRQRVEYGVAGPVSAVADDIGQVLMQRPAQCDVEHLCAAADAQHRKLPLERGAQQRELPGVALPSGLVGARMRLLTVGSGIDVLAAGDQQPVQAIENTLGDARNPPAAAAATPPPRRPR